MSKLQLRMGNLRRRLVVLVLLVQPANSFFVIWPWAQCYLKLFFLGAGPTDFEEYPRIFREDSFAVLAEAGLYQGPDSIEEYIKFGDAASAYLKESRSVGFKSKFNGYEDGVCTFTFFSTVQYVLDEKTTSVEAAPNGFETLFVTKAYLDYFESYIRELRIFFLENVMNFLFTGPLDSDITRNFICNVYNGPACAGEMPPVEECVQIMKALPRNEERSAFTGNSAGCRVLHASFAAVNSFHCPHISFPELPDDKGELRCQEPLGLTVEDLFTAEELQQFREEAIEGGIDPDVGFKVL